MSFESWCEKQCSLHKQFAFWSLVKEFENTVLLFVRSFRESNFGLYLDAMISLIPWFFALDRTNYARWLSVHIRDMVDLPNANREVFNHFNLGKFTVKRTSSKFSSMSIDQAHEQLNAVVKGDGGVIGLTENDSSCTHEEADIRIFLHVADLVLAGNSKIVIKTVRSEER